MLVHGNESFTFYLHHVIMVSGAFLMMHYRVGSFFPAMFLQTELTVVPQNALWVLQKTRTTGAHPRLVRAILLARVLLHVACRLPVGAVTVARAARHLSLAQLRQLPIIVWAASGFNVAVLSYLNTVWTLMVTRTWLNAVRQPRLPAAS